jgi:polyphosphate kinase 2 (PPK2 family)
MPGGERGTTKHADPAKPTYTTSARPTMKTPRLRDIDLSREMPDKDEYEKELSALQLRLLRLQQEHYHGKRRAIIAFEGWDAAGKGGAIRRLTEKIDPRGFQVWPIAAPTPDEQSRHYLYRFWQKLPRPQTWSIFDRTWYGRVLVERVEKLCTKPEWKRAYREINEFEKMLVDDGVVLVKIFLHISKKEQLRRFEEREHNPYKRWKITKEDWRNRRKWSHYERAIDDMFDETSTRHAPWTAIAAERKWYARVEVCRAVADALREGT